MMWKAIVCAVILCVYASCCFGQASIPPSSPNRSTLNPQEAAQIESALTKQIYDLLEHYKQADPVGLPGASVPDPFPVDDVKRSIGMGTLAMKNTKAYGFSKFRIKSVKLDLNVLMANAEINLDELLVKGDYTLSSLFTKASGPFTVTLKNVVIKGNATLGVERDGQIRTQNIIMDMGFSDMSMDFQNLGFMGSIFQSIINGAPNVVFDSIKPFMLKDAYQKIRTEVDTNIAKIAGDFRFPNSITPLDMAVAELRKKVRDMGYDPFILKDYNHTVGLFSMKLQNTWISGASSFYRVGNIVVSMDNNTLQLQLQVGTQEIRGSTQWLISAGKGMITRTGDAEFSVQHIKATFVISQSLDTRKRPQINDLQFELGNIQVRSDGAGTMDYIIEFLINVIPNMLRYQIMDALENPAKAKIQEAMNQINVEQIIKEKVPEYERMGSNMTFDIKLN